MTRSAPWLLTLLALGVLAACEAGQAGLPAGGTREGSPDVQVELTEWSVRTSPGLVVMGDLRFSVRNLSIRQAHELVVLETSMRPGRLIMQTGISQVDEQASGTVVGYLSPARLPPGGQAVGRLNLQPGGYVLLCNIPGHYEAGMYTQMTVN